MTENELFEMNGVKTLMQGSPGPPVRHSGWFPTPHEMQALFSEPYQSEPTVPRITGDQVFLWEALWHALGNKYPPFNWQLTGSCVHGGYDNALMILMGLELVNNPQAEAWVQPFTWHTYGLSRYLGFGDQTEGDGSFGMSMARAGEEGGVLPIDDPEADKGHICGPAIVYDAPTEFKWSSIRNHPAGLKERSKNYKVKYIRCRTNAEAEDHLRMRHPLTWAGNWGGQGRGVVRGTQAPLLTMPRRETWNHQQGCWGMWKNHPELSNQWYIQNQWWVPGTTKVQMRGNQIWKITQPGIAEPMHGHHPSIPGWNRPPLPVGGYWISDSDMEYQCRTGEVCALVMYDGNTGREIGLGNI